MTTQPGTSDDDGAVPVACRLTSAGLAAQNVRWERLAARAMTERSETADGLRLSFRREPVVDYELRRLVEVENQCCPWADWTVQTRTGHIVLDVRSAGEGIGALHSMFTSLHPARPLTRTTATPTSMAGRSANPERTHGNTCGDHAEPWRVRGLILGAIRWQAASGCLAWRRSRAR